MTDPWQWDESDLQALVANKEPESSILEFKDSRALNQNDRAKAEISKDASAFLNSNGGTIVYGLAEDKQHRAQELDAGIDPAEFSTEWLEQVIYSRVQPKIDKLHIHEIALTHSPGRFAYIVSLPKGTTAYQASDRRYYMRLNYSTAPMEDWQVRDVMSRASAPDLRLHFSTDRGSNEDVDLQISIGNSGIGVAEYCIVHLHIPRETAPRFLKHPPEFTRTREDSSRSVPAWWLSDLPTETGGSTELGTEWTAYLGPVQSLGIPIFKTIDPLPIDVLRVNLPIPAQFVHHVGLSWTIEAPHMEPKLGQLTLTRNPFGDVTITETPLATTPST